MLLPNNEGRARHSVRAACQKHRKRAFFSMRGRQKTARPTSFDQLFVNDIIPHFRVRKSVWTGFPSTGHEQIREFGDIDGSIISFGGGRHLFKLKAVGAQEVTGWRGPNQSVRHVGPT
jgi:hypothetical protein